MISNVAATKQVRNIRHAAVSPYPRRITQVDTSNYCGRGNSGRRAVRPEPECGEITECAKYGWKMLGLVPIGRGSRRSNAQCGINVIGGIRLGDCAVRHHCMRPLQCPRCETARPWSEHARARQRHAHTKAVLAWAMDEVCPDTKNKRIRATNIERCDKARRAVISNMREIAGSGVNVSACTASPRLPGCLSCRGYATSAALASIPPHTPAVRTR